MNRKLAFLTAASVLVAANAVDEARAQTAELEEIVVTGTRVQREGFVAPTPTTVLDATDLQAAGRTNIGEALADLPSARGSVTPSTTGSQEYAGVSYADLRGLGSSRTLVLVDGRRPVPRGAETVVDLNTIPMGLVERIDLVTGGLSAAYGSDAVAGVLNVILADERDGFRASAQYGDTSSGRGGEEQKFDFSYGFSFNGDRGHVILGGSHDEADSIGPRIINPAYRYGLIANPAYTPANGEPGQLLRPDIVFSAVSLGGLITGCGDSAGCAASGLRGLTFEPDGSSRAFNYGQYRNASVMSGGDVQAVNPNYYANLKAPVTRDNLFGRFTYDLAEDLRLKLDVLHARSESDSGFFPNASGALGAPPLTIRSDNAFLPDNIRAAMLANGLSAIQLGRWNADWGVTHNINTNKNTQGTVGLEGQFGEGWSWEAFYSYGEATVEQRDANQPVYSRLLDAVDSVIGPDGQPMCRSAATNPACVPIDVFGYGNASAAALNYIMGTAMLDSTLEQQEAAVTVHGEPFSSWAGPVSVAAGGEWRRQSIAAVGDVISAAKDFQGLNYDGMRGAVEVNEAFVEAVVPLVRDVPLFRALDFDGAVRRSDYSSAGGLTSWKLGASNEITQELRLRFTRSRDIRAPNLGELFQTGVQQLGTVTDRATNAQYSVLTIAGGNPNLDAESASSMTAGVVYQPSWAPRLDLSIDYYTVEITDAIAQISSQDIVDRCYTGNAALCQLITRDSQGQITQIAASYVNLQELRAKGIDLEATHGLQLSDLVPSLPGQLRSRVLVNYVEELSRSDGITSVDYAGVVGSTTIGVPRWRGTLEERYELERLAFNLRARYVGGGVRSKTLTIDQNEVAGRFYFDIGMEYRARLPGDLTFFGNLVNALDREAPKAPNAVLYDVIGRSFNVGVRMTF